LLLRATNVGIALAPLGREDVVEFLVAAEPRDRRGSVRDHSSALRT